MGDVIGEGAFSQVRSATVIRPGPTKGLQVAVKCINRHNLPREDEEDLLEEVSKSAPDRPAPPPVSVRDERESEWPVSRAAGRRKRRQSESKRRLEVRETEGGGGGGGRRWRG